MSDSDVLSRVSAVMSLFESAAGASEYLGEPVSQLQHAQQTADLAQREGHPEHVVLGCFLHDIGHLLGVSEPGLDRLLFETDSGEHVFLGTARHEVVGEQFLRGLGFPEAVTAIVRGHVDAKRYLVAKYEDYYSSLSEASKMTLQLQGGPMTKEEMQAFEASPHFDVILRMRRWEEQAKDPAILQHDNDKYRQLCIKALTGTIQ